jgi:hypothetical protein
MGDALVATQDHTIHFPRQIALIKRLRVLSFIINDITLLLSFLVIIVWLTDIPGIKTLFFQQLAIYPFTPVLFIFSCIPLLFGAKRHLISTHEDAEKTEYPLWIFVIPIIFASTTALLGFINFLNLTNSGIFSMFHVSSFAGLCFFLIGLALIPPYTQIPHRFHITQFLVFIISGLNVFILLENIYQFFSPVPVQHIFHASLLTAFSFVLFCSGLLLRWSNRGFIGNFTLDATASIFALRVFLINLFMAPVLAVIILFAMQNSSANMYQVLTVVVVCFAFISSLLLWMNVKVLYGHELEHLLMRESLRSHNIDLTKEQEKLQERLGQIEKEKQQYVDKLTSQSAWQDAVERNG